MNKLLPLLNEPLSNLVEAATGAVLEETFMRLYEKLLESSIPFLKSEFGHLLPDATDMAEAIQWIVSLLFIVALMAIFKVGRKAARRCIESSERKEYQSR